MKELNKEETIKVKGEKELKKKIFEIEHFIRRITSSITFIPKNREGLRKNKILRDLYKKTIEILQEIYSKDEKKIKEYTYKNIKKKYPEIYEKLKRKRETSLESEEEDILEGIEEAKDNIDDLYEYINKNFLGIEKKLLEWALTFYHNFVVLYFILKLRDFIIENVPEEYMKYIYELILMILEINFNKKTGKIKESSYHRTLKKIAELLETEEIKLKSLEESLLKGLTENITPEILEEILQNQIFKERIIYYKEDFEEEYYKVKLIPFIKIKKIKVENIEEEDRLVIRYMEYIYGVISNKYILIKKGINQFKKNKVSKNDQETLVNKKTLNIFDYQDRFLIVNYILKDDSHGEFEVSELKLDESLEEIKTLLKRVSTSENLINTKIGFYIKEGKLDVNYVKGYGKIKYNNIEINLGAPISLRYADSKAESVLYDYYSFINSERYFEEMPPLYKGLIEIFEKLKEENSGYLKPFLVTLGFTLGSIYIDIFKKEEALFPGLYFYGLKGTGKSLLLKLSRAILGIDDNRICSSFAQFRDLLSTSNNIAYLDEIPENFDKKSEGKELLKNLLTNIKVEHKLSGKDSDTFTMKGTFFATTNYPIENTFGEDDALEERIIFINFNYDNKVKESIAEKLNQIIENVKHKPLSPTEKGYTYLSNVIFLYYQLIKKDLFEETKIKEIIQKIKGILEPIIKTEKVNDYPRFRALVLPIIFGLYIFSKVTNYEDLFNYVTNNLREFVKYILREHPSYSFNIKETLYQEFVKHVGNFWSLVDIGYFSVSVVEDKDKISTEDEENLIKNSFISKLKKENLDDLIYVIKEGNEYFILAREDFIRNFFKKIKDLYNYKKLSSLKAELSKVGIKEIKIVKLSKKVVHFDLKNKEIYITTKNKEERVKFKLIRIPYFIIEESGDLNIIYDKKNKESNKNVELKTTKQMTLTDFFEKLSKIKKEIEEELTELNEEEKENQEEVEEYEI